MMKFCLKNRKQQFKDAADYINKKYPEGTITLTIKDSYANMRQIIEKDMSIITLVKEAMKQVGIEPTSHAIRGGTDGARLSFMGLPCPNLCTGGANYHGRFEYACIEQMELCVEILKKIVEKYAVKEI